MANDVHAQHSHGIVSTDAAGVVLFESGMLACDICDCVGVELCAVLQRIESEVLGKMRKRERKDAHAKHLLQQQR